MKILRFILPLFFLLFQTVIAQKQLTFNKGHYKKIIALAVSPPTTDDPGGGKYLVSAGEDHVLKLWNLHTGQEMRTFPGHSKKIRCLAFHPNGRIVASAGNGKVIKLWSIETGKQVIPEMDHNKTVYSIVFNKDGTKLFSGGSNGIVKIWDTKTGKKIGTLQTGSSSLNWVRSLALDPTNTLLAVGKGENMISIWDIEKAEVIETIKGHNYEIRSLSFSPSGKELLSLEGDNIITLWKVRNGKEIISTETFNIYGDLQYCPDGKTILASAGHKVMILDAESLSQIKEIKEDKNTIMYSVFSPSGNNIITAGADRTIKVWDTKTGAKIKSIEPILTPILGVDISDDENAEINNYFAVAENTPNIKIWDLNTNQAPQVFTTQKHAANDVVFHPNNKFVASIDNGNSTIISEIKTGKEILKIPRTKCNSPAFSQLVSQKNYVAVGQDGTIRIWDINKKEQVKYFPGHDGSVADMIFSKNGKILYSSGTNGNIIFWDIETEEEIKNIDVGSGIYSMALSIDEKSIFVGCKDGTIKEFNAKTSEKLKTLSKHRARVNSIDISPAYEDDPKGGKYIVSSGAGSIKLWSAVSGLELMSLKGHNDEVTSVHFSPNGKVIISTSKDGTVKFWDVSSGKLLATLLSKSNSVDYVIYTPGGKFDGTENGMRLMHYVDGLNIIPLSNMFEQYHTPKLLKRIIKGEEFVDPSIAIEDIKLPPLVKIMSPANNSKAQKDEVNVVVKATGQGGGIDEIRLYLNGKLVKTTQRGFIPLDKVKETIVQEFKVPLMPGTNEFTAIALSNQRIESNPQYTTVFYAGAKKTVDLHLFAIGIDNYKNSNYKLNYALKDAATLSKEIEQRSKNIFAGVNTVYIQDSEVTRKRILQEFEKLEAKVEQEDVFIFYYAGHGVMSKEEHPQFYLIPYDVTQLYGNNKMLRTKAISATEMQNFSTNLKAQKQLFIIDACQSGGMAEMLASRGAAKEKAISQLARSTGTYWLTASKKEQFAVEFEQLGHGLFSYCVLLALRGEADSGSKDKKITVKEINAFLHEKVPQLSIEHKGKPQYPSSYGYGQDFPIVIYK